MKIKVKDYLVHTTKGYLLESDTLNGIFDGFAPAIKQKMLHDGTVYISVIIKKGEFGGIRFSSNPVTSVTRKGYQGRSPIQIKREVHSNSKGYLDIDSMHRAFKSFEDGIAELHRMNMAISGFMNCEVVIQKSTTKKTLYQLNAWNLTAKQIEIMQDALLIALASGEN